MSGLAGGMRPQQAHNKSSVFQKLQTLVSEFGVGLLAAHAYRKPTFRNKLTGIYYGSKFFRLTGDDLRCDAHMNELPIPCAPWEPWYKDRQSFYNKVLVLGALWWVFSLGMVIYTESLFMNWGPPAQPGPPSDMVEECEDV